MTQCALRGPAVTFAANPFEIPPDEALVYESDALIVIDNGRITAFGAFDSTRDALAPGTRVAHYPDKLISAALIDTHVHYPQLPIIASYGEQLLAWLERYVFPAERRLEDPAYAARLAGTFLDSLLSSGTTTAAVYCTVHPQSVDAFFTESARRNTRMIAGKVLMDRNAPEWLRDDVTTGHDDSAALIARWHGNGRQLYAVTPRFAPTSTEAQLEAAGALLARDETLFLQTHLLENKAEEAWVKTLFPQRASYLDVYDHAGLVRPRSIFGHAVHATEGDFDRCHHAGCAVAHCPASNLFLGSGHFPLFDALRRDRPVKVGLGSDVAGGNTLSMLKVAADGYKVAQILGHSLHPVQALWLATAGAAEALGLERHIGRIAAGMEADLVVFDPHATPVQRLRTAQAENIDDVLFSLLLLGDERSVAATYVAGDRVFSRETGMRSGM
ncbi:guanine deaminase [Tanticharoenia sakaeratensis]|uniref:Guanine deaminase n=1 Tax=Tanticharoenia sakaeratensis NBRC 103193 TaxID=1231623 RepID=A0A0D6MNT4_9PROT|nr:guanine deaminase [Tanticharoenia sakaeratensis]GAN55111.1 guanine deaminase [Tanticharoenia sakaeratensis NBRC 103193]GBQ20249.1 guanine deaminase [Tanticharoenia sakaeratensis NBRC 103193]